MTEVVDQVARDRAAEAVHGLNNHATVTEIKLNNLSDKFDRMENILKWVGGLLVTMFLSTLAWSLSQQYLSNETAKRDLQAQIALLKEQQQLSRSSAAQTPAPPVGD